MEIFISIGERLREVRVAMGKSQTEFAEIAAAAGVPGATRQSQANYEKGRQMPSAAYLAAIAAAGADVLYVVTGQRAPILTNQSYTTTSPHMTETGDPVTVPAVDVTHAAYRLSRREQALIENYRGSDDEGRRAVEVTASALAHKDGDQKKSKARE